MVFNHQPELEFPCPSSLRCVPRFMRQQSLEVTWTPRADDWVDDWVTATIFRGLEHGGLQDVSTVL